MGRLQSNDSTALEILFDRYARLVYRIAQGVIRDSGGNLYGTAGGGVGRGCSLVGCGVVYKLSRTGKLTVLYKFSPGGGGRGPTATLVRDPKGTLYGTAGEGGGGSCEGRGCGTVFKLKP